MQIEKSVPRDNYLISISKTSKYQTVTIRWICRVRRYKTKLKTNKGQIALCNQLSLDTESKSAISK